MTPSNISQKTTTMNKCNFKTEYPTTWSILTSRFDFINFIAFSKKYKEKRLQEFLDLAYQKGFSEGVRQVSKELFPNA